jgi:hypothetical protein
MHNLPYAYAYALSDMGRIALVLMHIFIQPPSSYKTSDGAETQVPSTHATTEMLHIRSNFPGVQLMGFSRADA